MKKKQSQSYYSETFKWKVVQEVLSGRFSKEGARKAYGIKSNCAILYWMREFSGNSDYRNGNTSLLPTQEMTKSKKTQELEAKVKELEQQLKREEQRADLWQEMILVAENNMGISIIKKSGAKQSAITNTKKDQK